MSTIARWTVLFCWGVLSWGGLATARQPEPTQEDPAPITIQAMDGFNLTLVDQPLSDRLVVALTSPAHNWFAGTLTHLPTDRDTTIGLSMAGNNAASNVGDVRKWQGLRPVMTYADPRRYETYCWYRKNAQGHWIAGDLLLPAAARDAGNGPVPNQQVIPPALASQFISDNGQYWVPWREIDTVEAVPTLNIFRMTQRFALPTATIAMRIPFLQDYLDAYTARLREARLPGVHVDIAGKTPEGRALYIMRLEDPASAVKTTERTTILITAREHATEHATSWAVLGMLHTLLADTPEAKALRKDTTWLLIPLQDPDGSAKSQFNRMTDQFGLIDDPATPPEVYDYARYITDFIYAGHTIDMAVTLHNIEANEGEHILSPFADQRHLQAVLDANRRIFTVLRQRGFVTGNPDTPWDQGFMTFRLYGWIAMQFGAMDLAFEVNDRYPAARLSLPRLMELGGAMAAPLHAWCLSPEGRHWHRRIQKMLTLKALERELFFLTSERGPALRTPHDVMIRAY